MIRVASPVLVVTQRVATAHLSKSKVTVSDPALPQAIKLVYHLCYELLTHLGQIFAVFLRP